MRLHPYGTLSTARISAFGKENPKHVEGFDYPNPVAIVT